MYPQLLATTGREDLAYVHLLKLDDDPQAIVETVDSVDPHYPRQEKAVIIISTQFGCPMGCLMCDAGDRFYGNLTADQMLAQVSFVLSRRPENFTTRKLKVHFARMGEPALNAAVLEALEKLPGLVLNQGLIACFTTMGPATSRPFFQSLLSLKDRLYSPGHFQLQFSLNSTAPEMRKLLMPAPHLDLATIATLGRPFHQVGDRKVVLNFALAQGVPVDPALLHALFDPAHFMIKLTPINPTDNAQQNGLNTILCAEHPESADQLVKELEQVGFDTVVSIGEREEILIGSNCGQLVKRLHPLPGEASPPAPAP